MLEMSEADIDAMSNTDAREQLKQHREQALLEQAQVTHTAWTGTSSKLQIRSLAMCLAVEQAGPLPPACLSVLLPSKQARSCHDIRHGSIPNHLACSQQLLAKAAWMSRRACTCVSTSPRTVQTERSQPAVGAEGRSG